MITFPNAKINIGLNVLEKREDGYHTIESIFYSVGWCDAIEAIPGEGMGKINLTLFGNPVAGSIDTNLCVKAFNLLNAKYSLPSLNAWLLKSIPMGAGLGGGSADAAFFLKMLNELCKLNLTSEELKIFASQIGSDCTFFVENKPSLVGGKGDVITPVELDLSKYYISIVYPQMHVDTKSAYSMVTPRKRKDSLQEIVLNTPIQSWKDKIVNDFEEPIFKAHPQLAEIKNILYNNGALYASMTGSGSALYGIFDKKPMLADTLPSCKIWTSEPKNKV